MMTQDKLDELASRAQTMIEANQHVLDMMNGEIQFHRYTAENFERRFGIPYQRNR